MAARKGRQRLQEFSFIRAIQRRFSSRDPALIRGIGDDAAIVASATSQWWHVTTDLLAEGVHFDLRTASPESVGYRAAMANLSDLAAMGATPRYLLTSIAVPDSVTLQQVHTLYRGLMEACRRYKVRLIGGDTSASTSKLFVSIMLIGHTPRGLALLRKGAHVGDRIYVTGTLGDSLAGLSLLQPSRRIVSNRMPLTDGHRRFLTGRHVRPSARVEEGRWLNTARLATAAIDISDGLSGDLRHVCEESRVGADIEADLLPLSPALRAFARMAKANPVELALTGGEDYELLFTVSPRKQAVLEREAHQRGFRMTCIGTIRSKRNGMRLLSTDGVRPITVTSYEHFRA